MLIRQDNATGAPTWGYRTRLIAVIAGLLVLVFVPLVIYGIVTDRTILRSHVEQTGAYLVKNLARNSETGVFSESAAFLRVPLAAIADRKDVVWAAVYAADGSLIQAAGFSAAMMDPLPADMQQWVRTAGAGSSLCEVHDTGGSPVLEFYAPIVLQQAGADDFDLEPAAGLSVQSPEVIGLARVGISLAALDQRTGDILRTSLLLAGIYFVVACGALFFIQRAIRRPMLTLAEGARAIGGGDLTRRIHVHTRDEIEELAAAFNHMAARLQRAVEERRQDEQQREKLLEDIENKNRELENLVYVVSHDLRSPLVNIQGFSQILQQQASALVAEVEKLLSDGRHDAEARAALDAFANSEMPESIGFITAGAAKMDSLLSGLLAVSRTGRSPMNVRELDAGRLFADICAAQQYQLSAIDACVRRAELPHCYGDEHLLNQIFSNIISNAIRYRDPRRPLVIEISAIEREHTVVYCVRDNGQGIDERHLARIWNAFYRVDGARSDAGEGLGLAIVKRIVERHQGRVWAESESEHGSVFYVELQKKMFTV